MINPYRHLFPYTLLFRSGDCAWVQYCWRLSANLRSWFSSLIHQHAQLQHWVDKFELPACIWLGGLINPRALLVAMKQVASRSANVAVSSLVVETHITTFTKPEQCKDIRIPPGRGMLVTGDRKSVV